MRRPTLVLAGLGGLLVALTLAALLLFWPTAVPLQHELRMDVFVGLLVAAVLVYLAAVRLVLRQRVAAPALWVVLAAAFLARAVLLPAPPLLSSDIYRYVWDGKVQSAGINPYHYVPADPALAGLRDADIFPNINRATYATSVYGPAAQIVFAVVGRLLPTVLGMKLAMVGFEGLAVVCLLLVLSQLGLPRERVLIYAWNPLALWSFACDGHVDAVAVGLLAAALLVRSRRHQAAAGAWLAAASAIKFLPIAVAPALGRGGPIWRPLMAGAAAVLALYALYLSAGAQVIRFLPTYGSEEGLDTGSGFWLIAGLSRLVRLPHGASIAYVVAVAAVYATLALGILRARASTADDALLVFRDTGVLAAFATAAISPHYAWYFPWLALPCVVAPVPAVLWLSASAVLLYVDPFHDRFLWPTLVYGPAIGLALLSMRRRWRPAQAAMASEGSP